MIRALKSELALTLRILFRQPGSWVPTVLFAAMLYAVFGAGMAAAGPMGAYAMGSFDIYAVIGVGFYQFGVTVAQDRENPFTRWQCTLPGPASAPWITLAPAAGDGRNRLGGDGRARNAGALSRAAGGLGAAGGRGVLGCAAPPQPGAVRVTGGG